jgi:dihydroorotate dehydrogenase electron transfer subunit
MSKILNEEIIENTKLTDDLYRMAIKSKFIAENAEPGSFVNVECSTGINTILRRPISICDIDDKKKVFTIVYRLVGTGTGFLAKKVKGDTVNFVGPLGNGFPVKNTGNVLIIGGGIGIFPLYNLIKNFTVEVDVLLGFKNKKEVVMKKEFEKYSKNLTIYTDDGSYGKKGFVTDNLSEILDKKSYINIYTCGPEPMLEKVKAYGESRGIRTYLSLEQRMGCGIGACLVCSVKLKDGNDFKYGRVCKDGPVFDSREVVLGND